MSLSVLCSVNLLAQKSFEKKTNVIAFGADLGIYTYESKIESSPKSNTDQSANKIDDVLDLKGGGVNFGIGLQGKF